MESIQIGKRIEKCMLARGYTAKTLAPKLGISENALKSYLRGKRLPKSRLLVKLVKTLHVNSDYLLCLTDEKPAFLAQNCQEKSESKS